MQRYHPGWNGLLHPLQSSHATRPRLRVQSRSAKTPPSAREAARGWQLLSHQTRAPGSSCDRLFAAGRRDYNMGVGCRDSADTESAPTRTCAAFIELTKQFALPVSQTALRAPLPTWRRPKAPPPVRAGQMPDPHDTTRHRRRSKDLGLSWERELALRRDGNAPQPG
jgi:hypothetical protein